MNFSAAPTLTESFDYCRGIVRNAHSNFPLAFRLLSAERHRAMDALYAFLRVTDDLADQPGAQFEQLAAWRAALDAALHGEPSHPVHPALIRTVQTYRINPRHLFEAIDGVESDLEPVSIATFDELLPYCRKVASAVGLACLPIWGCVDSRAAGPADAAGIAFQLTNILRDLGEDRSRGRVYLPRDELARFGCPPETWNGRDAAFIEMMRFQADRAKRYYSDAELLTEFLPREGRAIYRVMFRTYRELLNVIERRGYDVFSSRVSVPRWRKLAIFASAWPVKWGWFG